MIELQGISASTGAALGSFYLMPLPISKPTESLSSDEPDTEIEKLNAAANQISDLLAERAERVTGEAQAILYASSEIAVDTALLSTAESLIRKGNSAVSAIWEASEVFSQLLTEAGGYLAERASDVGNIRDRIACILSGVNYPEIPQLDTPVILIAHDLSPADTTDLQPGQVLGIITEQGGPTSHTAIIARTLGIPAVVACKGVVTAATSLMSARVGLDARTGAVTFNPTVEVEDALRDVSAALALRRSVEPNRSPEGYLTRDGFKVPIYANVGRVEDVAVAIESGADGIGLLRTELLYLGRQSAPSLADQRETYTKMLSPFRGKRVVIRTLDAGADKPMAFINFSHEPNPALGIRGYRTIAINKDLLLTQLEAIRDASLASGADVWVMAPMISLPSEAEEFASLVHSYGLKSAGVMVEVPSAVFFAQEITQVSDFVSIGTNDLGQYLHAADRESAQLAAFNDPWQPALLRAVRQVAAAGIAQECPVGVCGEAASDPALAAVLIGLGVTSLSCNVSAIQDVALAMTSITHLEMQSAAKAALAAPSARAARTSARAHLSALIKLGF
ncbi:MAG: phosphoenolpyruvate--protein phosphotransferase [Actinobacteria bacterium]|nr:phosphoenolpyruvate--protein phosphotransferase [Actinomycetota bacterium]